MCVDLFDKTACYLVVFDSVIFSTTKSSGRRVNKHLKRKPLLMFIQKCFGQQGKSLKLLVMKFALADMIVLGLNIDAFQVVLIF